MLRIVRSSTPSEPRERIDRRRRSLVVSGPVLAEPPLRHTLREPRVFGSFVLEEEIAEDALGRVFRAYALQGERGFVRLRQLVGPELEKGAMLLAVERNAPEVNAIRGLCIGRDHTIGIDEGVPWVAWSERDGWTLDEILGRARWGGRRLPVRGSILVAERVATALENAAGFPLRGFAAWHGLVWPGFVSVAEDGDVRLNGFGIAEGVLPSLSGAHVASDLGPYLAPEVRDGGAPGPLTDVYAVGMLLLVLLTGRRATPLPFGWPAGWMRQGDACPVELITVLRRSLAPPAERYRSAAELRRALSALLEDERGWADSPPLAEAVATLFGRSPAEALEAPFEAAAPGGSPLAPADLDPTLPIERHQLRLADEPARDALAEAEELEDVADIESVSDIEDVERIENFENVENVENIENIENIEELGDDEEPPETIVPAVAPLVETQREPEGADPPVVPIPASRDEELPTAAIGVALRAPALAAATPERELAATRPLVTRPRPLTAATSPNAPERTRRHLRLVPIVVVTLLVAAVAYGVAVLLGGGSLPLPLLR